MDIRIRGLILIVLFFSIPASCSSEKQDEGKKMQNDVSVVDNALEKEDATKAIIAIDEKLFQQFYENPDSLSGPEKNFVFVENVEREVNNGGFSQFFYNSSGDYAHESLEALREIGAESAAELLEKAIDQFPDGTVPKDRDERIAVLEQIRDRAEKVWNGLDDKFYGYPDDIAALLLEYVRNNRPEFK
ncbi:DMP19 family protein [Thermodesulfobacteriota bacterium]